MKKIISSIIAKNQKELNERFEKVKSLKNFQLDVMDGKFVKNKSLMFDFKLPGTKGYYEAHLMVKNPEAWIKKHYKKVNMIIVHIESFEDDNEIKNIIKLIKSKNKKVGIAINPPTKIDALAPFLNSIDLVLIMTVTPGKYGSKFVSSTLKKIKQLRKIKRNINIEVDGHIDDKTIIRVFKAGANMFVSGSYLQKSKNIKKSVAKLKKGL